eukprot:scaffold62_cov256-Pinguiococcus_pyrenoidosus.AAC.10
MRCNHGEKFLRKPGAEVEFDPRAPARRNAIAWTWTHEKAATRLLGPETGGRSEPSVSAISLGPPRSRRGGGRGLVEPVCHADVQRQRQPQPQEALPRQERICRAGVQGQPAYADPKPEHQPCGAGRKRRRGDESSPRRRKRTLVHKSRIMGLTGSCALGFAGRAERGQKACAASSQAVPGEAEATGAERHSRGARGEPGKPRATRLRRKASAHPVSGACGGIPDVVHC